MVPEWHRAALCAQIDLDLWFPDLGQTVRQQKMLCGRCPVKRECLDFAIDNGEQHGVWGGMSVVERRTETSRRAAARASVRTA